MMEIEQHEEWHTIHELMLDDLCIAQKSCKLVVEISITHC